LMSGDQVPYRLWFREQVAKHGWNPTQENAAIADRLKLISLVESGIDAMTVKSGWVGERDESISSPMSCRVQADGSIHIWDGNHRACIMEVLGVPFELEVLGVDEQAKKLLAKRTLYQDSLHPMMSGYASWRVNCSRRYEAIARWIGKASVVEVGCSEGTGLNALAKTAKQVIGYEQDGIARTLAKGLNVGVPIEGVASVASLFSADVVVLESVLHHLTAHGDFDSWIRRLSHFDRIVVELPGNEGPWRGEHLRIADPAGRLLSALKASHPVEDLIYVDDAYFGRRTLGLRRQ